MRVVMAGWLAPPSPLQGAAGSLDGGGAGRWTGRGATRRCRGEVLVEVLGSGQGPLLTGPVTLPPRVGAEKAASDFGPGC